MFNVKSLLLFSFLCFASGNVRNNYYFNEFLKIFNSLQEIGELTFHLDFGTYPGNLLLGTGVVSPTSPLRGTLSTVGRTGNTKQLEAKISLESAMIVSGYNGSYDVTKIGDGDLTFRANQVQGTGTFIPPLNLTIISVKSQVTAAEINSRSLDDSDLKKLEKILDAALLPVAQENLALRFSNGHREKINSTILTQLMLNTYKTFASDF